MNFYEDCYIDKNIIKRTFKPMPDVDCPWHRDLEDRIIEVLSSGKGWKFQVDNELPVVLKNKMILNIPKKVFHRLIMGEEELILKIILN